MADIRCRLLPCVLVSLVAVLSILSLSCVTASGLDDLALEYFNLGQQFETQKDAAKAAEFYQKALAIKPDLRMARYNLARIKLQRDEFEAADSLINSLIAQDPQNQSLRELVAYRDAKQGKFAEAWTGYQDLLAKTEGRISAFYNLALLSEELGREKEAIPYLKTLIDLRPAEPAYVRLAALVAFRAKEDGEGVAYLARYREQKKADAPSLVALADELEKSRFHDQALSFLQSILSEDEKNPGVWLALAKLQVADGVDQARGSFAKSLENGQTDAAAFNEFLALLKVAERPDFEAQIKIKVPEFEMKAELKSGGDKTGIKKPEPPGGSGQKPNFML